MTRSTEICVLLIGITVFCDITNSSPLFEQINIERKINIGFKPFKLRPISFIKEKWGPFGRFGKKHTIEKRALEDSNVIDKGDEAELEGAAVRTIPVIEKLDEPPVVVPLFVPAGLPASSAPPPPVNILNTDISSAIPSNPFFTPNGKPESNPEPVPVKEPIPVEKPLFVPAEKNEVPNVPPPAPAEPPPVVEQPKPPRPGFISFFTELFSELMARFIARARASFSQLTLPPVQQ